MINKRIFVLVMESKVNIVYNVNHWECEIRAILLQYGSLYLAIKSNKYWELCVWLSVEKYALQAFVMPNTAH